MVIDVDKVKSLCIVLTYITMSVFIVLKNNEKETGVHLPKTAEYIFQCINGVLLFLAFNIKKIHETLNLSNDDKNLLLEIKQGQELLNENISVITTSRALSQTEPIASIEGDFIRIPRNLLNHKGNVVCGDYMINIGETARTER
jgi:hypothetical protein